MLIQTAQKPKHMQHKGKTPKFFQATVGGFTKPGGIGEVALQMRQLQNWANKIAGFRDSTERKNCRTLDRTRWEMLMTKGHNWLAGPMREIGTEMNEQTMEKLVMAAWKETEKEHKNNVTERIKGRNEKLNKAHSTNGKYLHQWIRQDYQTPRSITMNFQEIHRTLVESWRPIFARWYGGEEPRYSDFEELFGRFIPNEPMDAKRITEVELRDTVQRWSTNAAAGADSWKRCEWKKIHGCDERPGCRLLEKHQGGCMWFELQGAD